jgi:predicted tellurium resistance membrane protein TerC
MMMTLLESPGSWIALATLTLLETLLGVDNIIILSILVSRLPRERQALGRLLGLSLAMLTRLALLFTVVALTRLTAPLFSVFAHAFSGRELILAAGGLLLLVESVLELRQDYRGEGGAPAHGPTSMFRQLPVVVVQIALLDIVFSMDSVFAAVGLARADQVPIMAAAIVVSILLMMWVSGPVAAIIARHPSLKRIALQFLLLIGLMLMCEALGLDLPKTYLYLAMAAALALQSIWRWLRRTKRQPAGRP